jgi:2-oxoglutarate ferredoxin oxidoreductase subunit alpha
MDGLRNEIVTPRRHGPARAGLTFIGWGSTWGALTEAVDILRSHKVDTNLIHFNEIWPFPVQAATKALSGAKVIYDVESNATGQLAHILRAETGKKVDAKILKFDGRPITPAFIIEQARKEGCF